MSERLRMLIVASLISGCWTAVSGAVLVMGLAAIGIPIG
jgi:hypothetical protein